MNYDFDTSLGKITQEISKKIGKLLEKKIRENGISCDSERWSVISYLYKYQNLSQQKISDFLGYNKVTTKRLIDQMEKEGIVTKTTHNLDRRFNKISLSAKGKKLYKFVQPIAEEVVNHSVKGISTERLAALYDDLERIIMNLK